MGRNQQISMGRVFGLLLLVGANAAPLPSQSSSQSSASSDSWPSAPTSPTSPRTPSQIIDEGNLNVPYDRWEAGGDDDDDDNGDFD